MFNINKLLGIGLILGIVFLLAGGISAINSYVNGAKTYMEYRMNTLAPLYAGSILIGAFGLMYAYKNRGSAVCLVGFFITLFCYGFIEYLMQAVGVF